MATIADRTQSAASRDIAAPAAFSPVWLMPLLMVLSEPIAINVGGFGVTPLQFLLLGLFVPALMRMTSLRFSAADWLFLAYVLWTCLTWTRNVGVVSAGIFFVEVGILYLVVSAYLRTPRDIVVLVGSFFWFVLALGVLAMIESLTSAHFVADFVRVLNPEYERLMGDEHRMGLLRAGVVTHPILYGVFAGSMLAMMWYLQSSAMGSVARAAVVAVAVFFSLSAGPMVGMMIQFGCIAAEYFSRRIPNRATLIVGGALAVGGLLQVVASNGVFGVVATYMTFNPASAWYRQMIWTQVSGDIGRHWLLGMNPAFWSRRAGMSESIDAQWLLTPLTAGMPAMILLALCFLAIVARLFRRTDAEIGPLLAALRRGWTFAMLGLAFAGFAVAYFGLMQPHFHLMLTLGMVILRMCAAADATGPTAPPAPPRRRAAIGDMAAAPAR